VLLQGGGEESFPFCCRIEEGDIDMLPAFSQA
jgi:hypothetical protein